MENFTGHCLVLRKEDETSDPLNIKSYNTPVGDAVLAINTHSIYMTIHEIIGYYYHKGKHIISGHHATKKNDFIAVKCGEGGKFLAQVIRYSNELKADAFPKRIKHDIAILKPWGKEAEKIVKLNMPYAPFDISTFEKLKELNKRGFIVQGHCVDKKSAKFTLCRSNAICHLTGKNKQSYAAGNGEINLNCKGVGGTNAIRKIPGSPVLIKGNVPDKYGRIDVLANQNNQNYTIGIIRTDGEKQNIVNVQLLPGLYDKTLFAN